MKLKDRFIRFMYGRYGVDSFGKFTIWGSLILMLIAGWTHRGILSWLAWAGIIYSYFRMFSKNIKKRCEEERMYMEAKDRLLRFCKGDKSIISDSKTHKIYRCPQCRQKIRVPRGKGKIEITCPTCRTKFIKRT